jgi:hypothetical protein
VLKSLTVTDRNGAKVTSVRYDASELLEKRLENFPLSVGEGSSLSAFLDQMKGARVELKLGGETVTDLHSCESAFMAPLPSDMQSGVSNQEGSLPVTAAAVSYEHRREHLDGRQYEKS